MSDVHPNTVRVIAAAREAGLEITTRRFPEGTKTAADAAAVIGVAVGQIVKSLVFAVDGEIVMAYVSGANQLDEKKVGRSRWRRKVFACRRRCCACRNWLSDWWRASLWSCNPTACVR